MPSRLPRLQHGDQVAHLAVEVGLLAQGLRDLLHQATAEAAPQSVNGDLDRDLGDPQLPCRSRVGYRALLAGQVALQLVEDLLPVRAGVILAQPLSILDIMLRLSRIML